MCILIALLVFPMLITGRSFIPDIFNLFDFHPLNPFNFKSLNHQNIQNVARPRRQSRNLRHETKASRQSCAQTKNMLLKSNNYFINNHMKPIGPKDRFKIMMSCMYWENKNHILKINWEATRCSMYILGKLQWFEMIFKKPKKTFLYYSGFWNRFILFKVVRHLYWKIEM